MNLAALAQDTESGSLPSGNEERFAGYGVVGLPFASGHVLAMRRMPASSIGPGYTSVWHRTPSGDWTIWQDQGAEQGCARYFSAAVSTVAQTEIAIEWPRPDELRVTVPAFHFDWRSTMVATARSKMFNTLGSVMPESAWRSHRLLSTMGPTLGRMLGVGRVQMAGHVPNGQSFVANPQKIWYINESTATFAGADFGRLGRLSQQASLGDFAIPQKGVFVMVRAFFGSSTGG